MKSLKVRKFLAILTLAIITLSISVGSVGCTGVVPGTSATQLEATMVPAVDLDVYIYVNQQAPTRVPKSLTGEDTDISVQSLSIWGIVNNENPYAVGGALTFTNTSDAGIVFNQLKNSMGIYTKLSDRTIYFVQGSGSSAESLKNAIANNDFKRYDDQKALAEAAKLPSGGTTKLGLIGIVKPNQAAVDLAKKYLGKDTASTLESLYSSAKPEIIVLGIFSFQPIDLADTAQRISDGTIRDTDLGVVVSMASAYPGILFSPIASQFIKKQGLTEVKVGDLTAYQYSANRGNGKSIPIYLNISGNHIFATASGKDAYAQTLLTGINR